VPALAVAAFFTWREVDRLAGSRAQELQQAEARSAGLESRLDDTARRIDGIQAEVDRELDTARRQQQAALDRQEQTQQAVERSVSQLRAQMGRSQDGWLLAEVEYLLRSAMWSPPWPRWKRRTRDSTNCPTPATWRCARHWRRKSASSRPCPQWIPVAWP
jgi:hypothetical protein